MEKDIESQELEILKQNSLQCGERERERERSMIRSGAAGTYPASVWDASTAGGSLTLMCRGVAPTGQTV